MDFHRFAAHFPIARRCRRSYGDSTPMKAPKVNWIPLPDAITEAEVNLELAWSADERTRQAIERQAALMGFESPVAYLVQPKDYWIRGWRCPK